MTIHAGDAHALRLTAPEVVGAYQRDGAVCLRGLLSSDGVALLRQGSDHNLAAPSQRFLGDDIRHAPRPWTTSPAFRGLADALPAGVAMDHPLFPVVCPRPS
jgi:hypothetical protein